MDDELWKLHRGDQPVLATAIHDGHAVRPEVAALLALSDADRLREEDPFTGRWTNVAANGIVARRSRFEVDLNRPAATAVYRTPDDAWGLHVWREAPPDDLVERSMAEYHAFHERVRGVLRELSDRYGTFVVLDLHSYNHRRDGAGGAPADPLANPVVNVGTGNIDRGRWAAVVERFMADLGSCSLAGEPIDVRENVRFKGGHFSRWITENFAAQGCVLAVEVKKVFMDEWTGQADERLVSEVGEALKATVPGLLETVGAR
jgi:N-formylglutamate amidohydrolase